MAKTTFPKTDEEKAKIYLHCMVEIKERLRIVSTIQGMKMPALFIKEACYLQFRYICELIAIGCLVAQGDYEAQRAFREEYSPPKIFTALRKLYPNSFPQPATITHKPGEHHLAANNKPDAYSEKQVSQLWQQSGDHLHRASITTYLKKTFSPPPEISSIDTHVRGIIRLLECHLIPVVTGANDTKPRLLQVDLEDGTGNVAAHWIDIDPVTLGLSITSYRSSLVRQ